jgi:hypothetical protein
MSVHNGALIFMMINLFIGAPFLNFNFCDSSHKKFMPMNKRLCSVICLAAEPAIKKWQKDINECFETWMSAHVES